MFSILSQISVLLFAAWLLFLIIKISQQTSVVHRTLQINQKYRPSLTLFIFIKSNDTLLDVKQFLSDLKALKYPDSKIVFVAKKQSKYFLQQIRKLKLSFQEDITVVNYTNNKKSLAQILQAYNKNKLALNLNLGDRISKQSLLMAVGHFRNKQLNALLIHKTKSMTDSLFNGLNHINSLHNSIYSKKQITECDPSLTGLIYRPSRVSKKNNAIKSKINDDYLIQIISTDFLNQKKSFNIPIFLTKSLFCLSLLLNIINNTANLWQLNLLTWVMTIIFGISISQLNQSSSSLQKISISLLTPISMLVPSRLLNVFSFNEKMG